MKERKKELINNMGNSERFLTAKKTTKIKIFIELSSFWTVGKPYLQPKESGLEGAGELIK